ncbi:MAG: hypothetical protein ACREM8_10530 [Vulcanimicrobiaceae bacterium]
MPGYTIIAQPMITMRDPGSGRIVEGREVEFRDNDSGDHGRIMVPEDQYPGAVGGMIDAKLADMRAVRALSTPPSE